MFNLEKGFTCIFFCSGGVHDRHDLPFPSYLWIVFFQISITCLGNYFYHFLISTFKLVFWCNLICQMTFFRFCWVFLCSFVDGWYIDIVCVNRNIFKSMIIENESNVISKIQCLLSLQVFTVERLINNFKAL